ncbi:ABC transporter [Kiloniella litopenaei]|uniref:ABC transporter n=1 Tax=Kiloniella litopenaei TaxID=1549748 RepID=A0A0M2RAW9_9PROT|nr:ABC transporter ATP-binding protein [Kiloniella litopenaei]KKJ77569.1 ABC transporter [Kiloniella litopenaei]
MSALCLENVSHNFGALSAVNNVNLSIDAGEFVCLLGPSGCGKTTILRLAAGLERLQSGKITMDEAIVANDKADLPPEKRSVGLVFQDYALFPHLDVSKNIEFGLKHLSAPERKERVRETLAQVGMADYLHSYPHTLSGGQQQRVALARAIAPRPKLVLLDEPFSGLDVRLRNQVREETLRVLKENNIATLMVTHDPEEAMFMGDRVAIMNKGQIVQFAPPNELYTNPANAFVAHFFGEVNEFKGVCNDGHVVTPFGALEVPNMSHGTVVDVLVRHEGIVIGEKVNGTGVEASVLKSRMLGKSNLVDFKISNSLSNDLYVKARLDNHAVPLAGNDCVLELDKRLTFVFSSQQSKQNTADD